MSDFGSPKKETSAAQHRKNNKPLMEKRRRARINSCLGQLKGLVLEALKKDTSRFSKLEKADILEMTVKHLRSMQRQQMTVAMATDSSVLSKYRAGFNECAGEISRYLGTIDGLDTEVRARLLCHLSNCVSSINTPPPATQVYQATQQMHSQLQHIQLQIPSSTPSVALPGGTATQQPINCVDPNLINGFQTWFAANGGKLPGGTVQLMPATVPAGGVALVLPAQAIQNFSSPNTSNGLVYGNCSTVTNFAFSPVQCNNSPMGSPNSSVSSSHSGGQMSPVSSLGSPAPRSPSPSPKVDINQNAIPPAEICVKDESMWRPW